MENLLELQYSTTEQLRPWMIHTGFDRIAEQQRIEVLYILLRHPFRIVYLLAA